MRENDLRKKHDILIREYMVVTGSLTTGLVFYGPFKSIYMSERWASFNLKAEVTHTIEDIYRVKGDD